MIPPIEVCKLINKALNAHAANAEGLVNDMEAGGTIQAFKLAFNNWASVLMFYLDQQENLLLPSLMHKSSQNEQKGTLLSLRDVILSNETHWHLNLMNMIEEVFVVLNEDIGSTTVIPRTRQHLLEKTVQLGIAQKDHLEYEQFLLMPIVLEFIDQDTQLEVVKGLLIDDLADEPRWVIEWLSIELSEEENNQIAKIEKQLGVSLPRNKKINLD